MAPPPPFAIPLRQAGLAILGTVFLAHASAAMAAAPGAGATTQAAPTAPDPLADERQDQQQAQHMVRQAVAAENRADAAGEGPESLSPDAVSDSDQGLWSEAATTPDDTLGADTTSTDEGADSAQTLVGLTGNAIQPTLADEGAVPTAALPAAPIGDQGASTEPDTTEAEAAGADVDEDGTPAPASPDTSTALGPKASSLPQQPVETPATDASDSPVPLNQITPPPEVTTPAPQPGHSQGSASSGPNQPKARNMASRNVAKSPRYAPARPKARHGGDNMNSAALSIISLEQNSTVPIPPDKRTVVQSAAHDGLSETRRERERERLRQREREQRERAHGHVQMRRHEPTLRPLPATALHPTLPGLDSPALATPGGIRNTLPRLPGTANPLNRGLNPSLQPRAGLGGRSLHHP
ncbi:hypothetical protein E3E12_00095 [Formicincola oecophyllae]|uniref:Uncharacterized protein n=1 Tax=Formicincola oecophyllae TaxID=2558361 RepID=A0A4Y6U698_9PROT|nr:hypothetical protein [Formicincola oecophyllae]QDH12869.1 hypothetical protein E3E12_00095 [Formicincola oecophyllae]